MCAIFIDGEKVTWQQAVQIKEYGIITFQSAPDGAEVYLQNNLIGTTPVSQLKLEKGTYAVTVKMSGYQDWTRQIMVIENSTVTIRAVLEE